MEKPLFFAVLLFGFSLLDEISGLPIDFSSVGTGKIEPQWITIYLLSAVGFSITVVFVVLGCVCCRNGKGFKEFSNSSGNLSVTRPEGFVNPVSNSELTIFPPAGVSPSQISRFEPLPDIKPQTPNLRPAAFSYREREISSQDWFSEPYNNFPRNQLKYVQEYGRGWFGRVVEGEAQNIIPNEKLTKVMVKILHEDATPTDQMYFLHEVKFYRDLKHPNILRLLGRCLETEPFLIILECYPNGDLKTFLSQNLASARALAEQGVTLQMCSNITSGLQFMHENKFIHTDLAARNCLVGPDLTIKIGDYGNSIEIFKSDYYCAGSVALPVRWCAPETLKCTDVTIETREVTPPANIWSLAIVFWEICEFCKLPYAELNDDQVIVRVLGEKNYFLEKPQMFCLHKDELYHLMKLCWNPPVQRPTASQIKVILDNLISSGKTIQSDVHVDPKRISQDFEQRWQHLKPNNIPKMDNAVEVDPSPNCNILSTKLKHARVGDSTVIESPLRIYTLNKNSSRDSPRFCLKSEKEKFKAREGTSQDTFNLNAVLENVEDGNSESFNDKEPVASNLSKGSGDNSEGVNFEYITETKLPGALNPDGKFKSSQNPDVDSWLKGVEINNEEDESFVRNISEAIRDLDAALAMEKTSSSEDNSRKSSHQNSPGKESDENKEIVIDFKLDGDFSSFMNFTQKSFELSSLQNTEQPQSLNFTDTFLNGKKDEFDSDYGQSSLIMPVIEESKNSFTIKNDAFDESLKENDSLLCGQSRNSSDTDDEIWRKRIEKGEISEKVKEKSKSIANLMILTHIDASDESDVDLDKPFDRTCRNSFLRRSGSFAKSSLSSNNFGSENDITHAVLEDDFKESLKKLSNDHKEHGRFDSLGMILPTSARRENIWENLFRFSEPESDALTTVNKTETSQTDVNKTTKNSESKLDEKEPKNFPKKGEEEKENTDNSNNFLGNVASEKSKDNKLTGEEEDEKGGGVSSNDRSSKNEELDCLSSSKEKDFLVENPSLCDNSECNADSGNSSKKNSSHLEGRRDDALLKSEVESFLQFERGIDSNESLPEKEELAEIEGVEDAVSVSKNGDLFVEKVAIEEEPGNREEKKNFISKTIKSENDNNDDAQEQTNVASEECSNENCHGSDDDSRKNLPKITVTEVNEDQTTESDEVFEPIVTKSKPFKFVLKDEFSIPEIKVSREPLNEIVEEEDEEEQFELKQDVKPFKFVLKDDEGASGFDLFGKKEAKTNLEDEGESSKESGFISILDDGKGDGKDGNDTTVIIGACEDFTLDYFKGLKTTSEDIALGNKVGGLEEDVNLQKIIEDLQNNEENLDVWDKHLEKAFTQQLSNADFEDISFRSFSMDSSDVDNKASLEFYKISDNFDVSVPCPVKTTLDFLKSERVHTDKVEEPIHINRFTNLSGTASEEEYDNFKLRTPDDERSSDSGFRDKGSLSESVEDACEGKYNLEDIEAELEEAYVKGAFGNCEVEKENSNAKNSNNFEYEESKFYEDENKNEEDFSDIDGEIEFWQNKETSDYYPEISEFNPNCSQGWYLHPPDENLLPHNRNVNEDIVNALRNELRENLPVPTRSFDEFSDYCDLEFDDSKKELNLQYGGFYAIPLSPIIEEQDSILNKSQKNLKNSLIDGNGSCRTRKNMNHIIESVKSIDTNTFMQYLDYMVENEGRDFGETDPIEESIAKWKEDEEEASSPMLIFTKDVNKDSSKNFEEDIKNALGVESASVSESIVSDGDENNCTVFLEDLESGSTRKFVEKVKPEDDVLVVNVDTNEATLLESPKPKSHVAFVESERDKDEDAASDNSENDGLIFTPELLSPDRERSLSEASRTSNGTRTGDALSEITLSSPDLVPDCFSNSMQDTIQNNEADEIISILKDCGVINEIYSPEKNIPTSNHQDSYPLSNDSENTSKGGDVSLLDDRNQTPSEEKADSNEKSDCSGNNNLAQTVGDPWNFKRKAEDGNNVYEMSTSFMGDDDDDDEEEEYSQNSNEQKEEAKKETDKELGLEDSYTADWESDSSDAEEEASSSSGEFIWKDGDKESKVKAIEAADCDVENSLYEKSQSDQSGAEVITKPSSKFEESVEKVENHNEEQNEGEEQEEEDDSSTGSSASITDFVPSAWNSQATPSRPALRSPDKKVDQQNKKSVWFKKQKYHCVYEYPREPSDNEDAESSIFTMTQFNNCEKNPLESGNKHFTFEVSTVELPNKHFPYGISNVIDYSSYADWDVLEGDDGDLSLTDTDSDNGKNESKKAKESDFNFYNLSPFDYDFNNTALMNDESEFFVSSSSRPFQGGSSSQFFPGGNSLTVFDDGDGTRNSKPEESELIEKNVINSKDFVTPDSGVEDSANVTPLDKKMDHDAILLQVENPVVSKDGILTILDNLKFNFNPEIVENNAKKTELESNGSLADSPTAFSNSPSSPLSPSGLGELRHTRDRLKLDLPHNHNAELGAVINKKSQQKPLKF